MRDKLQYLLQSSNLLVRQIDIVILNEFKNVDLKEIRRKRFCYFKEKNSDIYQFIENQIHQDCCFVL